MITHRDLHEFYIKTLFIEHPKILEKMGFRNISVRLKPYIIGIRVHETVKDIDIKRLRIRILKFGSIDNIKNFIVDLHTDILNELLE